mmetsp:Transcript_17636/g.35237  ORF Transcript_17636/g.35237 Transcript_17636/m.35237 type:complete len:270 (-) Transcript_17636:1996-2805(-)
MRIERNAVTTSSATTWHRIVASLFAALIMLFMISGLIHFLSSSGNKYDANMIRRGDTKIAAVESGSTDSAKRDDITSTTAEQSNNSDNQHILSLTLDISPPTKIRIAVLKDKCPKAYEFLSFMVENQQQTECNPCTIYRGEPVPTYWGSKDYPDRYFDKGRWGPPYALVQGGLVNSKLNTVEQDNHRPKVLQRGMVAWAGGNSIHFFIALADHPEWGDVHTAWGEVLPEDMSVVDALVKERPLKVLERNNPVLTNFVEPMYFHLGWEGG